MPERGTVQRSPVPRAVPLVGMDVTLIRHFLFLRWQISGFQEPVG